MWFKRKKVRKYKDPNAPGLCDMWKYDVLLAIDAREIVKEKFKTLLLELCDKEQIKVRLHDTIYDLNEQRLQKVDPDNLAVGVYSYKRYTDTKKLYYSDELPRISLYKESSVFTLAHELGHHFAIKTFCDETEETANRFVQILAENLLTNLERYILSISLECHSGLKLPYPEITLTQWKEFQKTHNLK